jgi:hypothetical protein
MADARRLLTRSSSLLPLPLALPTETLGFWHRFDIGGGCEALPVSPERTPPPSHPAARHEQWCQGNPTLSNTVVLLCTVGADGVPLCVLAKCTSKPYIVKHYWPDMSLIIHSYFTPTECICDAFHFSFSIGYVGLGSILVL